MKAGGGEQFIQQHRSGCGGGKLTVNTERVVNLGHGTEMEAQQRQEIGEISEWWHYLGISLCIYDF